VCVCVCVCVCGGPRLAGILRYDWIVNDSIAVNWLQKMPRLVASLTHIRPFPALHNSNRRATCDCGRTTIGAYNHRARNCSLSTLKLKDISLHTYIDNIKLLYNAVKSLHEKRISYTNNRVNKDRLILWFPFVSLFATAGHTEGRTRFYS